MNRSTQCPRRSSRNDPASTRQRVLKAACQVFARRGFDGTHIREICNLAGVNLAALCYHFHTKDDLYAAVQAEARQQLSVASGSAFHTGDGATPRQRLQAAIESLFATLTADSAWIAHLLVRELADDANTARGLVGDELQGHLVLIKSIIRDAAGGAADHPSLRLAAFTVVSQCVFFCAAATALLRIFPQMAIRALRPHALVSHLSRSSLRSFASGMNSSRERPPRRPPAPRLKAPSARSGFAP
jgi:TetR/AcrR family transcriptional regulator, regulator of cefoperazone and chloramphenicol sensitivity